ncbi:hypothetical protein, conserved [Trypanosoma brucei gambiense DAL972]|uniref:Uncharacterized protein n=1 Tax=Trypanosoma brucei gambiense (strain MHOM/CI/86/DAL972) TaxID=679716 RepID=C9ZWZ9_TRYB9|nr:hypothetical protein, conserved [Trypanosoma brucei gambiense DAL972]CBH13940.1 hypothetical protein, conserved [Trypanosoma brucei gambiense DAL972]|eukprot:XP_011776214.1 hypothetical protein, conserved [Trypanosoma brucei gambiense DAL972]
MCVKKFTIRKGKEKVRSMSSNSSDVYVIEDSHSSSSPRDSSYSSTAGSGADIVGNQAGLTRTSDANACSFAQASRMQIDTGTNTEEILESDAIGRLTGVVAELFHSVTGSTYQNKLSQGACNDVEGQITSSGNLTLLNLSQRLLELARRPPPSGHVKEALTDSSAAAYMDDEPEWLGAIQHSMERTRKFFSELDLTGAKIGLNTAFVATPTSSEAETTYRAPSGRPLSLAPEPLQCETEAFGNIKEELCKLQDSTAEVRLVLNKEGVDSIIPLYNELLALRSERRQNVVSSAEALRAYLITQEECFNQRLVVAEGRELLLSREINRNCAGGDGSTIETLARDVEKLSELSRELKRLRDEHQRHAEGQGLFYHSVSETGPERKRQRTSDEGFKTLLARQLQADEQVASLRRTAESYKSEVLEWKRRYELAVRSIDRPQDSAVFNSLLEEVRRSLLQETMQRSSSLCQLFGWKLISLDGNSASIALIGNPGIQLTLPVSESLSDERSSLATGIVLARKVMESCSLVRESQQGCCGVQQGSNRAEAGAQQESTQAELSGDADNCETAINVTDEVCKGLDKASDVDVCEEAKPAETVEVTEVEAELADSKVDEAPDKHTMSEAGAFYSGGLWEE